MYYLHRSDGIRKENLLSIVDLPFSLLDLITRFWELDYGISERGHQISLQLLACAWLDSLKRNSIRLITCLKEVGISFSVQPHLLPYASHQNRSTDPEDLTANNGKFCISPILCRHVIRHTDTKIGIFYRRLRVGSSDICNSTLQYLISNATPV